jgi:hypothetical protein
MSTRKPCDCFDLPPLLELNIEARYSKFSLRVPRADVDACILELSFIVPDFENSCNSLNKSGPPKFKAETSRDKLEFGR